MGNYKSFEERRRENWFKPEDGRLIGTVENISTSSFTLSNEQNNFSKEIFCFVTVPRAFVRGWFSVCFAGAG
jgi:hypothetical protein